MHLCQTYLQGLGSYNKDTMAAKTLSKSVQIPFLDFLSLGMGRRMYYIKMLPIYGAT